MASRTYTLRALVLRKTKLSEADLILTLLAEDGSQKQAVAKGARKPTSSFSSRLELFSVVDLLCVEGKSLDIVKEARLVEGHEPLRGRVELTYAASPLLELLAKVSQPNLSNERLYASSIVALNAFCCASSSYAPGICAAQILKILALEGLRPSLGACASCGKTTKRMGANSLSSLMSFSFEGGGVLCPECSPHAESIQIPPATVEWAEFFLRMAYSDILEQPAELNASFDVLRLCQGLIHAQLGIRLKSLDMLFTCGLF